MKKIDMLTEIKERLSSKAIQLCKIPESKLKVDESRSYEDIHEALIWIRHLPIDAVMEIRNLLSEEIWQRYELMDCEDFREIILLNERLSILKIALSKRPNFFKGKKYVKQIKTKQTSG